MKRLLLICWLLTTATVAAREPVHFDLPYTVEYGKYVVRLKTRAGERRFVFDTGAARTIINESLYRELGLKAGKSRLANDFEGHSGSLPTVVLDSLGMGPVVFRNHSVLVMPDSSYLFRCLGFDGIAGSDLLGRFVVRMPNADSTITITDDIRLLGKLECRAAVRLYFAGNCPLVAPRLSGGESDYYKVYMKFDTGSSGFLACRYDECRALIGRGIARDVRRIDGHSGNLGWTNRSVVNEAIRGVIPMFELGEQRLEGMPFNATHGGTSKIGCGIFRWGAVVVDYPGRRFWLLPHVEQPGPPDVSVQNVAFTLDSGRLVVGQVWDEALQDVVAPGDRVVLYGTTPVDSVDVCRFLRGEIDLDKPEVTVERKDGTRVRVSLKRL